MLVFRINKVWRLKCLRNIISRRLSLQSTLITANANNVHFIDLKKESLGNFIEIHCLIM